MKLKRRKRWCDLGLAPSPPGWYGIPGGLGRGKFAQVEAYFRPKSPHLSLALSSRRGDKNRYGYFKDITLKEKREVILASKPRLKITLIILYFNGIKIKIKAIY
ncbi:hypothetical protein [Aliikangiella coralliicola]|uniref:Uncharacterized protein n=1 Tax=Aliikangiella coralliicola TaxID=2592383 RepID=A0A545U919_9GAMM|nr:hypothetical protein [Aliikangiella coralliicola]TQV85967.1 hypothetical protein FLL46_18820 [Aliikangiella coralliicola]